MLALLLLPLSHAEHASFIVLKGKHMGSEWFAAQINQLPGIKFAFEAGGLGLLDNNLSVADSANNILSYFLQSSCHDSHGASCEVCARECRAVGLSLELTDNKVTSAMLRMTSLMPNIPVVLHVRTNYVKHAMSFLRTTCPGQRNHLFLNASASTKARASRKLFVLPELLLARAMLRHRTTGIPGSRILVQCSD